MDCHIEGRHVEELHGRVSELKSLNFGSMVVT